MIFPIAANDPISGLRQKCKKDASTKREKAKLALHGL